MLQAVMSLVKGSAAAQPGSSSSFRPCGEVSPFSVTTQVLLRSVVESSHCPIMSFFSAVAASCALLTDEHGDHCKADKQSSPRERDARSHKTAHHQRAFAGVSATGVSGGLPANQAFRLSTTS